MAKILMVEDSDIVRLQLREILENSNYEVLEAKNGFQGLEVIKSHPDCNLILCDINMPDMDGLTMCQKLKEIDRLKSIPILMLTAEASADMKQKGKEIGVTGWIIKPWDAQRLKDAISKVISKANTGAK